MVIEKVIDSKEIKDQEERVAINILHTAYVVKSTISQALKEHLLTPEQYNILRILKGKHPVSMCVRDIASRMIERSSNVPRIIDRLEAKHFVERRLASVDKRETAIFLTKNGIGALEKATKTIQKKNRDMCGLSDKDVLLLNGLLDRYRKD